MSDGDPEQRKLLKSSDYTTVDHMFNICLIFCLTTVRYTKLYLIKQLTIHINNGL